MLHVVLAYDDTDDITIETVSDVCPNEPHVKIHSDKLQLVRSGALGLVPIMVTLSNPTILGTRRIKVLEFKMPCKVMQLDVNQRIVFLRELM